MNRRVKILCLATYLVMGAYLTQLAGCFTIAANSAVASFPITDFLDSNQRLFGIFAPCGTPNIQLINQNGEPQGTVLNTEDDLVYFCPVTTVITGG